MGVSRVTGNLFFCLVYVQWPRKMGQIGKLGPNLPFCCISCTIIVLCKTEVKRLKKHYQCTVHTALICKFVRALLFLFNAHNS